MELLSRCLGKLQANLLDLNLIDERLRALANVKAVVILIHDLSLADATTARQRNAGAHLAQGVPRGDPWSMDT
jgi:hypothetical protein